jgi:release factor glutamine methyltransferase
VLVPRQDTETLVEAALECAKTAEADKELHILDMCTGSGCILISILKEMPKACGTGVDLSELALEVAERNARTLEVADRAEFIQGDLFSSAFFKERQECIQNGSDTDKVQAVNSEMQNIVHEAGVSEKDIIKYAEHKNSNGNHSIAYDMIISNPPYIPTAEIEGLMEEVRLHDPRMALDGLEDGLYFYRTITRQAKNYLAPGGWLLYEIGCSQGEDVADLLRKEGYEDIEIRQDLCGLDRVVLGRKKLQEEKYV